MSAIGLAIREAIREASAPRDLLWMVADRVRNKLRWKRRELELMYEEGYEYGIRCCVTWIATMHGVTVADRAGEYLRKAVIVREFECISRIGGLTEQAASIMFGDPAATGMPGVLLAAEAGVKPLERSES